jgi:hypothetical protein
VEDGDGGEKEGWEEIVLGGGFIRPNSHVTFERVWNAHPAS